MAFSHNKTKLINRGLGGDTLLGAMNRVNKMLSNSKYDDVDQYIIEIGTNDVLLPSLEKRSFLWRLIIKKSREKRLVVFLAVTSAFFKKNMKNYCKI